MKNWINAKIKAHKTSVERRRLDLQASLCFNEHRLGRVVNY